MKGRVLLSIAAVLAVLGLSAPSHAQDFPSRTVRIVMGFGAGGLGDIAGRAIGQVMSQNIGQPVITETSYIAQGTGTVMIRAFADERPCATITTPPTPRSCGRCWAGPVPSWPVASWSAPGVPASPAGR